MPTRLAAALGVAAPATLLSAAPAAARCDDAVSRALGRCVTVCTLTYDPIQRANELLHPHAYVAPCVH